MSVIRGAGAFILSRLTRTFYYECILDVKTGLPAVTIKTCMMMIISIEVDMIRHR